MIHYNTQHSQEGFALSVESGPRWRYLVAQAVERPSYWVFGWPMNYPWIPESLQGWTYDIFGIITNWCFRFDHRQRKSIATLSITPEEAIAIHPSWDSPLGNYWREDA